MIQFLYSIDVAIFFFINRTISNPVTDALWPLITDYATYWPVRIALLGIWILLIIKGGRKGRTVAFLVIAILVASDQLSSTVIKALVARPRPCHEIEGAPVLQGIHLLVHCGGGKSFPSSHAVNNFAMATLFAYYYRRWTWAFFGWAILVAISRVGVGVHYPSDIAGGAMIGMLVAAAIIGLWIAVQRRFLPGITVATDNGAEARFQERG